MASNLEKICREEMFKLMCDKFVRHAIFHFEIHTAAKFLRLKESRFKRFYPDKHWQKVKELQELLL